MKTKVNKKLLIPAVCVVLVLCAVAGLLFVRYDLRYMLADSVSGIWGGEELRQVAPSTKIISRNDPVIKHDTALMLINGDSALTSDMTEYITEYKDSGVYMNVCMTEAYGELSDSIYEKFGQRLYVMSAYRTAEEQAQAVAEEGEAAANVGASEHQAGLAADVYVKGYAGKAFLKTEVGRYVNTFCSDYGFIIRYPYYGKQTTGIGYEPWHIRYVGEVHARIIAGNRITLEEYISSLEVGGFYSCGNFIISRQNGDFVAVPEGALDVSCSPDNCGNYIYTFSVNNHG